MNEDRRVEGWMKVEVREGEGWMKGAKGDGWTS